MKEKDLPIRDNLLPDEIDPLSLNFSSEYNFATYHEPLFKDPYWEWMNHGLSKPGAVVTCSPNLPEAMDDNAIKVTVYAVAWNVTSDYIPPAKHDPPLLIKAGMAAGNCALQNAGTVIKLLGPLIP
jgi:hypothetical protein